MYRKISSLFFSLLLVACSTGDGNDVGTCEEILDADFVGGLTLETGTCWTVDERLNLSDGTVTIESGVSITFATDIDVNIASGGTLRIVGTIDDPVQLGTDDPLVTWQGISMTDSQGSDNRWEFVVIDNAGSDNWTGAADSAAAVYLTGSTTLAMAGVEITNSESHALIAHADVDLSVSGSTFAGNAKVAHLHPQVVGGISGDNVFADNEDQAIRVTFGNNDTIVGDEQWAAAGIPYRIEDRTFIDGDLILQPGVDLTFAQGTSLIVSAGASLTAEGTGDSPILFRAASTDVRGFWKGIEIESGGTATPLEYGATFSNCVIDDAGGDAWSGDPRSQAAIYLNGTSAALITDSTLRNSAGYAVWASGSARIDGFSDNMVSGNAQTMLLHPDRVGELAGTSEFTGNDDNDVHLVFGNNDTVTVDANWKDIGTVYSVRDRFFVQAHLIIDAGVVVEFAQDREMIVDGLGSLAIAGTALDPVVLRGAEAVAAGYWKGIQITTNDPDNVLTYTTFENAGSTPFTGDPESDCALYVDDGAQATLNNVTFGPGGGYGVFLAAASSVITCDTVTFDPGLEDGAIWDDDADGLLLSCP